MRRQPSTHPLLCAQQPARLRRGKRVGVERPRARRRRLRRQARRARRLRRRLRGADCIGGGVCGGDRRRLCGRNSGELHVLLLQPHHVRTVPAIRLDSTPTRAAIAIAIAAGDTRHHARALPHLAAQETRHALRIHAARILALAIAFALAQIPHAQQHVRQRPRHGFRARIRQPSTKRCHAHAPAANTSTIAAAIATAACRCRLPQRR